MPHLKHNPRLSDLQYYIKELCAEKGWDKNSYSEIFLLFSEEVGELAKAMRQHRKLQLEDAKNVAAKKYELEEEFADVLNYLLDLANCFNVDLEKAFRKKNKINEQRSWLGK